jgi:hypothetical protein
MTDDDAKAIVKASLNQLTEKMALLPLKRVVELFDHLFQEVVGGEPWQCPGCGYQWPGDDA